MSSANSPQSYYSVADRLTREVPGAFQPNQYFNPRNPEAHYRTTGPEIWRQTDGRITAFVAGVGTGGTITGVGKYLKEQNPAVRVVGADPEGSIYSGEIAPYKVEGVGEDFWPGTFDREIVDEFIQVTDRESFVAARKLARQEGILVGGSAGLALHAAIQVAVDSKPDDVIVVLLPGHRPQLPEQVLLRRVDASERVPPAPRSRPRPRGHRFAQRRRSGAGQRRCGSVGR